MCMVDDSEPVIVLSTTSPKARHAHKCNECGREIGRGETYLRERYVFEGEMHTHKTCAHCQVARDWLTHECGGFIYTGIEEDIREHVYNGHYGFAVVRLAAGMERHWRRRDGRSWPIPKAPKLSSQ